MEKRDLKVDLGIARGMKPLNTSEYYEGISLETAQQYMMAAEGWPYAIERATKAEALNRELVERLEDALSIIWHRQVKQIAPDWEPTRVYRCREMLDKAKEVIGDEN